MSIADGAGSGATAALTALPLGAAVKTFIARPPGREVPHNQWAFTKKSPQDVPCKAGSKGCADPLTGPHSQPAAGEIAAGADGGPVHDKDGAGQWQTPTADGGLGIRNLVAVKWKSHEVSEATRNAYESYERGFPWKKEFKAQSADVEKQAAEDEVGGGTGKGHGQGEHPYVH